jgi:hypothetical protein
MQNSIITQEEWYQSLVDDCKAINTEADFNSRWERLAGYHAIGRRLVTDAQFMRYSKNGRDILSRVTNSTGISERNLYRSMQFFTAFPDLTLLPNGKAMSWRRVVNELLPEPDDKPELFIHADWCNTNLPCNCKESK